MADKKLTLSGQCYNKVERYGKVGHFSNSTNYPRKKTNSFSNFQSQDTNYSNSVNYYSDNASSNVPSSAKKPKSKRSLSSSPTFHSHYAGAKFSEPPSPNVLPLPPTHWTVESSSSTNSTPRSTTPEDFETDEITSSSTPISKPIAIPVNMNHSVELFFKKCSFNHLESCRDFTKQLKTLLNVPV